MTKSKPTKSLDWVERFDEEFLLMDGLLGQDTVYVATKYLKKFIQKEISLAVSNERERVIEEINKTYPLSFMQEYEYGKAKMLRGKRTLTAIVQMSDDERKIVDDLITQLKKVK